MSNLLEYKCPCCGGALEFNSQIQKMKCPYCETEFEMSVLQQLDEALQQEIPENMSWQTHADNTVGAEEGANLYTYICNSCGGEIIGDATLGSTSCPYCGNPVVMYQQFAGSLRPDYIIPFKLDKNGAKSALARHLMNKRFLPKVFKDENHIDEIRGVYVPFWLFDASANASIRYKATKTRAWSDLRYNYLETSYFSLFRSGTLGFQGIPVDCSEKIPNDLTESLEPYDMSEAVDFQTAYMAGYLADKYDVGAEQCIERANERVKRSTETAFRDTVSGYMTVTPENSSVQLINGSSHYALLPVWILNTTWNNEKYTFAMNGQTGKFVGDLPVDKGAASRFFWLMTLLGSAVTFSILSLLWFLIIGRG